MLTLKVSVTLRDLKGRVIIIQLEDSQKWLFTWEPVVNLGVAFYQFLEIIGDIVKRTFELKGRRTQHTG
jgi:hypothetical protein